MLGNNLNLAFTERWLKARSDLIDTNNKLGIFLELKDTFETSSYLKVSKFPLHRIALTKLRLSAHRLPIETGRYEQITREGMICPFWVSTGGR